MNANSETFVQNENIDVDSQIVDYDLYFESSNAKYPTLELTFKDRLYILFVCHTHKL